MKILHTADWHIGDFKGPVSNGENLRRKDIYNCLDFLYETALAEKPDLIVISGDVFHVAKVWAERGFSEVSYTISFLRKLAKLSKVCLLRGTPNHDGREQFNMIKTALLDNKNVFIFDTEDVKKIPIFGGCIQVAAIPGFDKIYYRNKEKQEIINKNKLVKNLDDTNIDKELTKDVTKFQLSGDSQKEFMEIEDEVFSNQIEKTILDLKAQCEKELPSILLLHHTVSGCMTESGKILDLRKLDVVVDTKSLKKADFDMVLLGHIHRPQKLKGCKNTFYAGAVNTLTFGDEGQERGFYIHELEVNNFEKITSRFISAPSRNFFTLKLDNNDIEKFINNDIETIDTEVISANTKKLADSKINIEKLSDTKNMCMNDENIIDELNETSENPLQYNADFKLLDVKIQRKIQDSIVRVIYSCTSENNINLNKALLEKMLYRLGAFYVQEIISENIIQNINKDELLEANTPVENLEVYLAETALEDWQIDESLEIAKPIIDHYLKNTQTTAMTGVFMPIEIEVENYRSYSYQKFSYENINFATINGENGSGKSSLFMDAILDALYDETREGRGSDTSWISNREDAKQGKIIFIFKIGDREFRISRTRKKKSPNAKNKPTPKLELCELINQKWKDISKGKISDTQEEIKKIVGMESNLLCSCGLIMQDKYGIFLESDKKERMNTLSNILGLNIYDNLYTEVSSKVTDLNREIKNLKNQEVQYEKNDLLKRDIISEIKTTKQKLEELKKTELLYNEKLQTLNNIVTDKEKEQEKAVYNKRNFEQRKIEKQNNIISLQQTQKKFKSQVDNLEAEIKDLESKIENADILIGKEAETELDVEKYKELERKEKELSVQNENLKNLKERRKDKEKDIEVKQKEYQKIDGEIKKYEKEYQNINKEKEIKIKLINKNNILEQSNKNSDEKSYSKVIISNGIIDRMAICNKYNDLIEEKDILERKQVQYSDLIKEKDILEKKQVQYNNLEKAISSENTQKIKQVAKSEKEIDNIKAKLDKAKEKSGLLEKTDCPLKEKANCSFLKDAINNKYLIPKLEENCEELEQKKRLLIEDFDKKISELELERTKLDFSENILISLKEKLNFLEKDIEEYKSIIALKSDLQRISQEITNRQKDLLDKHKNLEEAKTSLCDINDKIESLKDIPQEVKDNKAKRKKYEQSHELLVQIKEEKIKKESYKNSIADKKKQIIDTEKEIENNNKSLDKIQKELEILEVELETIKEKIDNIDTKVEKEEISNIQENLHSIKFEMEQINKKIGMLEEQNKGKEIIKHEIESLKTDLSEKSKQHIIYEQLKKAFSKEGIPHNIIRKTIPEIENLSSRILGDMSGGRMSIKFVTDKMMSTKEQEVATLDVLIDDYQIGVLPYVSKSGGERVKIALSIILALAEIKTATFGVQLGFLFIDEPPFLDEQGVQVYCDALETIKKRYKDLKIIAITHDQAMKARFPESIEVQKTEEGSKVTMIS